MQRCVLLAFMRLLERRPSWEARLLVFAGPSLSDVSVQFAGLIAGALSLTVSRDEDALKQGLRRGAFDFLVTTDDEALRILKNQARKRCPVSVALVTDPLEAVPRLLRRGLAPEMVVAPREFSSTLAGDAVLAGTGTMPADDWACQLTPTDSGIPPRSALYRFDFADLGRRQRFDRSASDALLPLGGGPMLRWLRDAGRVLPRTLPVQRFLLLSEAEFLAVDAASSGLSSARELQASP